MADLREYLAKRDFAATPEPSGAGMPSALALRYSIQNHAASHLHWDLRLEWQGVLLSWAIPKGPSYDPEDKRLAVRTEDHPLSYIHFEGPIPAGNYGAGTVMLWDRGWWQPLDPAGKGLAKGHLHFRIFGRRLTGAWNLVLMHGQKPGDKGRDNWLLVKAEDEAANQPDPVKRYTTSVETGRSFDQIAAGAPAVVLTRTGPLPAPIEPELATLVADLADPARYWHEIKFDGYRALIALGKDGPRAYTRSGLDWSNRFASLLPAFDNLTCDSALIDGEIVAGAGLQGFSALQAAIKEGGPFLYAPFDLLSLDGRDLRPLPLSDRRKALEKLMKPVPPLSWIELSPVIHGAPDNAFAMICGARGEGLVAKLRDAPYRSGRGKDWLKIKCLHRAEFVIVGYEASDKRGRPFSSLALAAHQAGKLIYVGQVGTGFDEDRMADLAARMAPLRVEKPPVSVPATEARGVTWLRPELVAEIRYAELTAQDRLRHAVFIDLREDKAASQVVIEKEAAMPDPTPAGITITHPDRVLFPNGVTKGDVAEYYAKIASVMLIDTANRPVSLLRLPEGLDGERFFQKHPTKGFPAALKQVEITESSGKTEPYFYVTDAAGLVGAAQMGTVEFHIWGAHRDDVEKPDRLVFDLDPDEGLSFADVRDGAILLRKRLQSFGLEPGVMLSGGKGVHLVVPLKRTISWQTLKLFAEGVARLFAAEQPDRFVAEMSKAKRKGRIFIDWLRNERGATAIAPLSVRARPDAPVAAPITWEELPEIDKASAIGMDEALRRYAKGYPTVPVQGLTKAVIDALAKAAGG